MEHHDSKVHAFASSKKISVTQLKGPFESGVNSYEILVYPIDIDDPKYSLDVVKSYRIVVWYIS